MKFIYCMSFLTILSLSVLQGEEHQALTGDEGRVLNLNNCTIIDMTWPFNEQTICWPTSPSTFRHEKLAYGKTDSGFFYSSYSFCGPEHGGTHIDAPVHFGEGRQTTDEIPLSRLIGPAVVIDVTDKTPTDLDYRLTRQDVLDFEETHGQIEPGDIVLLRTGWGMFWPDRRAYLGDDTPGDASNLHFPSFGKEAVLLLVEERKIGALGVDVASIDYGQSRDFPVHQIVAAQNVPAIENIANLGRLPPRGATVIALPMKIDGGSGGPVRIVALLERK